MVADLAGNSTGAGAELTAGSGEGELLAVAESLQQSEPNRPDPALWSRFA